MKICVKCNESKEKSEFCKDKNREDGLQPLCKACHSLWYRGSFTQTKENRDSRNLKRRSDWKIFIDGFKTKCRFCDEHIPEILDFHHKDPVTKEFQMANLCVRTFNETYKQQAREEIRKCVIVCSNCHRKIHLGYITI